MKTIIGMSVLPGSSNWHVILAKTSKVSVRIRLVQPVDIQSYIMLVLTSIYF